MRKLGIGAIILSLVVSCIAISTTAFARDYVVREVISLSVGESQQREFTIAKVASVPAFEPIEVFVIVAAGSTDIPAGNLSIGLSSGADVDFGALMDYSIIGFGYSLDAGFLFVSQTVTTPYTISADVAVDSSFGFLVVGAYISDITGMVETPVPFTMTFSLGAQAPAE